MDFSKVALLATLLVLAEAGPVYKRWITEQGSCAQQCSDQMSGGYRWRLSDCKSPQISSTFPSILEDHSNIVIWTVSILPRISNSSNLASRVSGTVPSAQIIIGMTPQLPQFLDNSKFNYQPGTVYEFSYNAKTTTKMNGASEDSAIIDMTAKVEIEPITKCDLVMRIKDASLRDSLNDEKSQEFQEAMMKQHLKFSFQDGRIDHICAMDGESTWTLNIKRGILSAFQNSMDSFDRDQNLTETDVVGTCLSEYKVVSNGLRTERVEKTKDLLGCSNREGYRLAVQSIGYNAPSYVKSLPLMKSEYKCTQTLDPGSNILQSSTCSEEHVFRPFSYGNQGAMSRNIQTLTFDKTKKAGRLYDDAFSRRTSLLFEHQFDIDSRQAREGKVEERLRELCQAATDDVRPELPEMMNQLVASMREVMNEDVFSRLYAKITRPNFCPTNPELIKQHYLDAIPMVGTVASVKALEEFISKKYVTENDVDLWLLSLSFIQRPSREMVAAATPLLDVQNITGNAMLAVSSLASGYCNVRPDCGKDSEISALIKKLMETVNDCNPQNGDAKRIMFALRALGNIGHSQEPVSRLSRCLTNRDVPADMRIAAIDAFRRIPCDAKRSDLMGVFRDESEDSEIRINAYIALMKCPSGTVVSEVRQVLEKEKSNQVGSFVWSHLTNLMETSDPHMQDIRNILQDEELKKEFNLDQRKFSRNYEGSFFLDSINTGAKVDSNVIFSQKSFIPRSANLNLTIDLFGHAINFLEFGGRVKGLERILEKKFVPSRRASVKPEGLGILKNKNKFGETDEFAASSYLRVFGNELRYWDATNIRRIDRFAYDIFINNKIEFRKSMSLLDGGVVIPTCIGLPLNLTITATGSVHLDRSRDILHDLVHIKLTPSAALQVKGEMTVDAHLSKAGLKMVSVAHTSTAVLLKLSWGELALEIPKAKTEIFNLKSDFFIVQRNIEKKQKMLADSMKKFTMCTGNSLKSSLGLTVCQQVQFPNASSYWEAPYFPFTGPVLYDLHMRNDDAPKGYVMKFHGESRHLSLNMDTPDSKMSRLITINVTSVNRSTKMVVVAPWRNMKFEGEIDLKYRILTVGGNLSLNNKNYSLMAKLWTHAERTGELNLKYDILTVGGNLSLNNNHYSLIAKLGSHGGRNGIRLTPYLAVKSPTKKMIFHGDLDYVYLKSLEVDMSAKGFGTKDITWKVSSHILPKEIAATSTMRIGKNEYAMIARVGRLFKTSGFKYSPYLKISVPSKDVVEVTSEVSYDPHKKLTFDFKLDKLFSRAVSLNVFAAYNEGKGKNTVRIQFKAPRGNFRVIGDFSKKKSVMSSRVICSYAFGPRHSDRLTFSSKLRDLSLKNSARYLGIVELSSKKKEFLNFRVNGQLAKAANHLETKFDLQYGNPKNKATNTLIFSAVVNRSLKPFAHSYSYAMSIQHPGQNIDYKVKANHVQSAKWPFRKFENKVMVEMAPGKVVQTILSYNNVKVKGLPTHESEIALSYPGRDMKIADKLTQVNKNTYENHFTVQWQKGREAAVQSTYTKTGKDIHNIENTFRLPNKKVAKATAMLQATPGAYKAKVQFDAEENSISKERMFYTAEARLTHANYGKQTSRDISLDVVWSPINKFSANIGTVQTDSSVSSKLTFSTPFSSLKTLDSEAKYAWNNGKYSSMMKISWNKMNELFQDFSITHPGKELELNYLVSSDMEGKKSFLKIAATKVGPKMTGLVKVNVLNSPKFNVMLSHTKEENHRKTEGSFSFDIWRTRADFKMSHASYPLKDETISTGEGKLNLPFQKLKEIGSSYSLKHNNHVSSIDIGYSSSLKNFRNGKLAVAISRNLPKMLECKIQLTQMDKTILSLQAMYERKGDHLNIDVDITDPHGEKITTSANVDLFGPRKTSNFDIKSKPINLSINSYFEYQNGRFVDGELKIIANGQNLKMSANYGKDGATHKVTGSLELPDGRLIDGKISLLLKDTISVSLLVNSPDFPDLTNIDINLVYNGNSLSSVTKGYVKILPHLEESEFEASLSMKENINLAFVLKTPFGSMRNVKATISLQGNLENTKIIKSEFELNKNKVIDLAFRYKVKSIQDFYASFDLKTSHRRLDAVYLFIKHSGDIDDMESILKAKVGREMRIYGKLNNSPSYNEVSLKGEFKDFDDVEASFTRIGDLNDMQTTIFYKLEGKEQFKSKLFIKGYGATINAMMNIPDILDFEFKSELDMGNISFNLHSNLELQREEIYKIVATYEHLAKLYIKTSFPSYNDELTMTLNGDLKMFNALAKLTHNTSKYELVISNQGYYRKIDAQLVTPFFTDMASFIFNGDEETFNAQAKFMHDNDQYELVVSNRKHYQQLTITLSTPFSSDRLDIDFEGDLPSFKSLVTFSHNKVEYKLQVSNDGYYQNINAKLTTPFIQTEILFTFKGNLQTFSLMKELIYNGKKYKLEVLNKDYYKEMSIKLTTPFSNNSLSFSLDGNLNSFNAKLKFIHFKEPYELVIYNSGFYREIEAKLSTPYFRDMLSISVDGKLNDFTVQAKVMHNHKNYQVTLSRSRHYRKLSAELTTPFYEGSVEFSLKGNLQSFHMDTKVLYNNDTFQLTVSTVNYYRQMKAELTTPYFKESVDFLFSGILRKFNTQLTLKHNEIVYEMKASNREFYRQMNLQLTTPFVSCDLQFEGTAQVVNVDFKLNIGKAKYECLISTKKYFQIVELELTIPEHRLIIKSNIYYKKKSITGEVSATFDGKKIVLSGIYKDTGRKKIIKADLTTPYFKDSLQGSIAGTLRKFNANMKLQHDKDVYEMLASNKNYYNELDLSLKAPGVRAKFQSEGNLQKCQVSASLKMATDLYELTLSNQNYLRNINLEVFTPRTGKCTFNFAFQGNWDHFVVESQFSQRNYKYELNISSDSKTGEYGLKCFTPQINVNGRFNGDLKSFSFNADAVFKKEKYEVMASTKNYFREISAKLTTPQLGKQSLSVKINGQLRDFSGFIEVKNNNELYRSEFSLENLEFRLSLPKLLKKLQVKLNGNWKNFEFIIQLMGYDGERIELSATNKNFKEMSARLAIPQLDDIDVFVKTNGNLRNGEATMKMSYGENNFENEVEINFDGSQARFEIEPSYMILGRSGKAKLQIDLMFEAQSYKYEFEADVEGIQVKSTASVKISEMNVLMTVNIPTFDASEMKLRIVSEGFQKTDMMLNLKSPWTGMTKIFYEHNCQMGKSFSTKGYIERDEIRFAGYSLDTDFADDYSFDFKCDYSNSKDKIETKGDLKFQGVITVATLSANTPFRVFKEFFITAQTKMLRDGPSVELDVKLPNQEYSLNIDLSDSNFNALLNVNMDKKNKDKQYQFQTSYKNTDQRADVSRSFNLKMVHQERTVSLDSSFEDTERLLLASTHLIWDGNKHKKIGAEFVFQKGNKKSFKCKLNTPRRNVELFGSFSSKGNQNAVMGYIMLDADRSPQKIEAKADVMSYSNRKNIDLVLKFPNQKNGMRIKTVLTGAEGNSIFSGKAELSIDQDPAKTLTIDAKLSAHRQNYSLDLSAAHPSTDFSARMLTFVAAAPESFTSGMDLVYTNVKKQQQNVMIRGEIRKLKREFNLKMQAQSTKMELSGSVKSANRFVMFVKKTELGKDDMETSFIVDPNVMNIRMGVNYDQENPSKVYRLDAAAQENKAVLKAYRMEGRSRRGTDTRIIAELRPSHILFLSLRWNPNLLQDLNQFLYEKLRQFGADVKTFGVEASEIVSEELLRRFELTQRSLMADFRPVLKYFETEHESLYRDVSRYVRNFNELYNKNSFYLKTMKDWLKHIWSDMWMEYKMMAYNINVKMNEFSEFLSKKVEELSRDFDTFYGRANAMLREKISKLYKSIEEYVRHVQEYYLSMIHNIVYSIKTDIIAMMQEMPDIFKGLIDDIKHHPFGARMIVIWTEINDSINNKQTQLNNKFNDMTAAIYSAQATVSRHFNFIRHIPAVDAFLEILNEAYQQMVWAYRYWNVKSHVLNMMDLIKNNFYSKLNEQKKAFTDLDINTLVFAPKRGEIVVEFRYAAAVQVYDLIHSIMETVKELQQMIQKYHQMLPQSNITFWDIFYMLKPSSEVSEWLPPFKAHATLFGGQHITTFDGRHLDYKGTCSYLMARDFVNGQFTVVANYDPDRSQRTVQSITVTTAMNKEIEIFSDYKVKFQGEYTDLPIKMTDSFVMREGDLIVLKSTRGYEVTADLRLGLYTVDISGWYFNRVAGMFGTYNHEPSDDMTMYNMMQTDNIEEFAASWWSASSVCTSHRNVALRHSIPDNQECRNYFVDINSPFRNCFRQVRPDVFYHVCKTLRSSAYSTVSDVCDVSAFYMGECQRKGVDLQMPKSCVSCSSIMGNNFFQGENMVLKSSRVPAAADVIFVVEERKCNNVVGSRLPDIVKHIKSILEQKGLQDSRFGLIGFGGYRNEPNYIHTMEGERMSNSDLMIQSLDKLPFPVLPANVDVMKAVMMAAEYPFRAGVRKTVILVTCTGCHETDVTTWELAQMLEKFDITLHVLADHDFKTKGNLSSKTTYLYGADKSHAYSEGMVDAEMETNIVVPEDNCVQLALESNGSYFDSKKLEKRTASISFMASFAERISESLMPTSCQRCVCVPDQRGVGQSICNRCPKATENLPVSTAKGFSSIPSADEHFQRDLNNYLSVKSHRK